MPTIDVSHAHASSKEDAKKLAEELVRSTKHLADLELRWEGDRLYFTSLRGIVRGARGTIDVNDEEVRVRIDLPVHLRVLKGMMESKLSAKLARFTAPRAS